MKMIAAVAALVLLALASALHAQGRTSVWDGIYTVEQAERGKPLYEQGCGDCHGQALEGDDMSPPLIGSDFLWDWNGATVGDLYERLRISMPDGKPNSMSTQEKADVLAFILNENDFPAGDEELPPSGQKLAPVAFEAAQP